MNNNPLISFVVPIYNVEQYLKQCVDSIINQTYKNIEVILVDDGSTDNSIEICDEYVLKDKRIQVLHKQNGGLSSARNEGLKLVKGEYVLFIDSDDYLLDKDLIEKNISIINNNNLIIYGYEKLIDDKLEQNNLVYKLKNNYSSSQEFMRDCIYNESPFNWNAWRYIYKTSILNDNNIEYPLNKKFEDVPTTYKAILNSSNIGIIKDDYYVYRIRSNSITTAPSVISCVDYLDVTDMAIKDINNNCNISNELKELVFDNMCSCYIAVVNCLTLLNKADRQLVINKLNEYKYLLDYIKFGKQNIIKLLINILGINITSKILGIRRKYKYGK